MERIMTKLLKQIAVTLILFVYALHALAMPVFAYINVFSGTQQYQEITFTDIESMGEKYWANEAIYQMSAFGIIEGFENSLFKPLDYVSRAQALAFIYRALSLENEAEKQSSIIAKNKNNNEELKKTSDWSDGYIGIALSDGVITQEQYKDAFSTNPVSFDKKGPATRQEIAFYIALAFDMKPVSDNSFTYAFSDSYLIDLNIRPYFNALISERIFMGSGDKLNPKGSITRAEMAQVLLNLEKRIIRKLGLTVYNSTITSIPSKNVIEVGDNVIVLDEFRKEGFCLLISGKTGNTSSLETADDITYYVNGENEVIFAKTTRKHNTVTDKSYITSGIVYGVSGKNITLYDENGKTDKSLLRNFVISSDAVILNKNQNASLNEIKPDDMVFLKVTGGYVSEISFAKQTGKEVVSETVSYVDEIYKAELSSYNNLSQTISVKNVFILDVTNWDYTKHKGLLELKVEAGTKLYNGNTAVSTSELNDFIGNEVILAVNKGMESDGKVKFLRISEDDDTTLYNGKISSINTSSKILNLSKSSRDIACGAGTIIVKDGKLAAINDISESDYASVSVNKTNSKYDALFVFVDDDYQTGDISIYYARIEKMTDANKIVFTTSRQYGYREHEIFYTQKSMSFKITNNTIFYDKDGIINNRELNLWSSENTRYYANIVVKDKEAIVVSIDNRASEVITAKVGSIIKEGSKLTELSLYRVWSYESGDFFETLDNCSLKINDNTIVLKNGKPVSASEISVGDSITVFYSDEFIDIESDDMMKRAMVVTVN